MCYQVRNNILHWFEKTGLDNIGIHPLLIKGTPLSYSLYPTSGLRPRCDTDFLIPQGDVDTTAEGAVFAGGARVVTRAYL